VGVGGYASGPILKAAARQGVPILIQEQNSYAGVTNRILARTARSICVAYEGMERYFPAEKIHLTGNPIRRHLFHHSTDRLADLKEFGLDPGKRTCLVVGGSLGAGTLNRSLLAGLNRLNRENLQLIWQCGKGNHEEVERVVLASGMKNVKVMPFISRMECAYGAADVIISRAGAITISELCVVGKPAILVPSPNVAEDHQTKNAQALSGAMAAVMIPDRDAEKVLVDALLELMEDEKKQQELSENIKKLGITNAAERIAAEVTKLLENK
jgi:UDP-N-acetylglucosamine--N-acetylmuramyl-(pentapeptide) pyrophosphoryl-undecaprenol N-acetylglucosamine transferase